MVEAATDAAPAKGLGTMSESIADVLEAALAASRAKFEEALSKIRIFEDEPTTVTAAEADDVTTHRTPKGNR